jgi:hypothetical protein
VAVWEWRRELTRKTILWEDVLIKSILLFLVSSIFVVTFMLYSLFRNTIIPLCAGISVVLLSLFATREIVFPGSAQSITGRQAVEFTVDERNAIRRDEKRVQIIPSRSKSLSAIPLPGNVCDAFYGDVKFGSLKITDVKRSLLRDIAVNDIVDAGFVNRDTFLKHWEELYKVMPNEAVLIIRFTPLNITAKTEEPIGSKEDY